MLSRISLTSTGCKKKNKPSQSENYKSFWFAASLLAFCFSDLDFLPLRFLFQKLIWRILCTTKTTPTTLSWQPRGRACWRGGSLNRWGQHIHYQGKVCLLGTGCSFGLERKHSNLTNKKSDIYAWISVWREDANQIFLCVKHSKTNTVSQV